MSPRLREACPENDSFEAIATVFISSLSVRTWNSISAPRLSRAMYPSSCLKSLLVIGCSCGGGGRG
jgi:hypothetical protein